MNFATKVKGLLSLLALALVSQISVAQTVIIPGNAYAFQWSGDPDIGLYFSAANSRYEFRDLSGTAEWWCNPISGLTYHRNDVVIGATSNSNGRLEVANAGANSSAVAARGALGPTSGFLGAQGTTDFDGVTSLDIPGQEVGVLGISTGGSSSDNSGVYGHSNGRGVYGEHSTSGNSASLGTLTNALDATGPSALNGNVTVTGDVVSTGDATFNISGSNSTTAAGPFQIVNGASVTALDGNEIQAYGSSGTTPTTFFVNFYGGNVDIASTFGGDRNVNIHGSTIVVEGSDDEVGIGEAIPQMKLHVQQAVANRAVRIDHQSTTNYWHMGVGTSSQNFRWEYNGLGKGQISQVDGAYSTISDARLKENIAPLGDVLDKVLQLKPSTYNYIDAPQGSAPSMGFIAQEVEALFPNVVRAMDGNDGGEDLKVLAYSDFGILAIAAIQEMEEAHEEEVEDLRAQLDKQNDMIEELAAVVARLDKDLSACCTSSTSDVSTSTSERGSLSQNIPNPFNGTTTINYYLPKDASFASLKVVDINGSIVKEFNLQGEGFGQVSFASEALAGGNYFYSLFVDGEVVDTKQMNLVK